MSRSGIEPKRPWRRVPAEIRHAVAGVLGAPVVRGARVWGGYGPTPTFRLLLADGRRAFVKGCSPDSNPVMREGFLLEVRVYAELRQHISQWAPVLYGHFRLGDWEMLVLQDLGPKSVPPWTPRLTRSIMHALAAFHLEVKRTEIPPWISSLVTWLDKQGALWAWSQDRIQAASRASVGGPIAAEAATWFSRHGLRLAHVSQGLLKPGARPQLLHGDVRSDNMRWNQNRLFLLDWASVLAGAPEFEVACLAQSIAVEGGPAPERTTAWYQEVTPLDPALLDAAVCCVAGFFAERAWREELPGMPRLRTFQRQQLLVSLRWALERLGLEVPWWLNTMAEVAFCGRASGTLPKNTIPCYPDDTHGSG